VNHTQDVEDRLTELEALDKVLQEGLEAYDRLASDLVGAKDRLTRILVSKDKRGTVSEAVWMTFLSLVSSYVLLQRTQNNFGQMIIYIFTTSTLIQGEGDASDILWVTLIRLWPHSFFCYLPSVVGEFPLLSHGYVRKNNLEP
jgi:hypothetical protein